MRTYKEIVKNYILIYNKSTRKTVIMAIEITKNPRSSIPRIFIF